MKTLAYQHALFAVAAILFTAETATAHISLLAPAARYDGSVAMQSKACPCGVGQSNRLCDVEGDRSDDFRSPRVTTYAPGETVTLQWDEYVGHAGRYRVAFDPDGADLDDFNANILLDVVDPAGNDGNIGNGSIWELEVTLPDTPCNNCTLQLVQIMDGDTSAPVLDPVGRSSYYQCADIVIAVPGVDMGTPSADMGPAPGPDAGNPPGPTTDMGTPPVVSPPPDSGQPGQPAPDAGPPANVEGHGGCSVTGAPPAPTALGFAAILFAARRRRSRLTE